MSESKLKEKRWKIDFELDILKEWEKSGIYKFNKNARKVFSIDTPPPYASGAWHMGGAAQYTQIDMIARYRRMTGYEVIFPIGIDRNGLPIEVQTEKHYKISIHETPREKFIELCKEFLDMYGTRITNVAKRLGLSCNSWKKGAEIGDLYETDDPMYRKVTQSTFIELYKKGLVYEDERPNNMCVSCRTTIADAEIEHDEKNGQLNYIKFPFADEKGHITIATTRPELICTAAIILFNPEDERYKAMEGKKVKVPIFGQIIELKAHPYAKSEFGSGMVMISSFGDNDDIKLFAELGLEPKYAIDGYGKMTSVCKGFEGLSVKDARKKVVEKLEKENFLEKIEKTSYREPVCWRCKTPIEFVAKKEFYLKQVEFKEDLLKMLDNIKLYAPSIKQRFVDWISSVNRDWPISRRRYYGTEIPLWYCNDCGEVFVPEKGKYYQPWKQKAPGKCKCGSSNLRGEERIFDTWMDSSISEIFITGFGRDNEFFKKHFPASIRPQGKDIIRTWAYYTMLRSWQLFKEKPWKECWVTHHVVDANGKKMSKSKGNVISPEDMIEKFGSDAVRLWNAFEGNFMETDIRVSEDRVNDAFKFLTKLWNISRFVSMFPEIEKPKSLEKTDEWIIKELENTIAKSKEGYENYEFNTPARELRGFIWNTFAPHYLEMVKARAYNRDNRFSKEKMNSAHYTMHYVLREILKAFAPIIPFFTDKVWTELYSKKSIHTEKFSDFSRNNYKEITQKITNFNAEVWKKKEEAGISLSAEIDGIKIPKELNDFEDDLINMHKLR